MRYTKRRPGEYCQPTPDACSRTVEAWGPLLRKLARDLMRHRNSYSTTHTDGPSAVSCANTSVACSGCQENVSTLRTWRNCTSAEPSIHHGCLGVLLLPLLMLLLLFVIVCCWCCVLLIINTISRPPRQTEDFGCELPLQCSVVGKRQGFWLSPWCCPSPCLFQFFISSNEF